MIRKLLAFIFKDKTIDGSLVPVVRVVKANSNLNVNSIKERLVKNMIDELIQYTSFEEKEEDNGVILITARLDVLRRYNINADAK